MNGFSAHRGNYEDSSKESLQPHMLHMCGDVPDGGLKKFMFGLVVFTHILGQAVRSAADSFREPPSGNDAPAPA